MKFMSPILIIKISAAFAFIVLGLIGLSGYLVGNKSGFRKLPAYVQTYGPKWGPRLHFSKVVMLPILLGGLLILSLYSR